MEKKIEWKPGAPKVRGSYLLLTKTGASYFGEHWPDFDPEEDGEFEEIYFHIGPLAEIPKHEKGKLITDAPPCQ
jgi:hypothetical protein